MRTDPRSVVTDAIAMSVSTLEHVKVVTPVDRDYLTKALNGCAGDTTKKTEDIVQEILGFTQGVLTTPSDSRSISRIVMLMSAGNIVIDMNDPLTQFLNTLTDFPLDGHTAPWANVRSSLDDEFMALFTSEWWELASNMLDAIYLDVKELTDITVTPFSLLLLGVLPPVMTVLYANAAPEFASFPGELLLSMFASDVAREILLEAPYIPVALVDWANEHYTYNPDTDN